jgi:hypothetical protein
MEADLGMAEDDGKFQLAVSILFVTYVVSFPLNRPL